MPLNDADAVRATVQDYFQGLYHTDEALLRRSFHPTACLYGHLRGKFTHSTLDQWLGRIKLQPAPSQSGEAYDMEILSLDIVGDAASVKATDLYRGLRFTEYLTMLRLDGRWVIVNKAYHHE